MESMTSQLATGSKTSGRSSRGTTSQSSEGSEGSAGEGFRWPGAEVVAEAYARYVEETRSEKQSLQAHHEQLMTQHNKLQHEKQNIEKKNKVTSTM